MKRSKSKTFELLLGEHLKVALMEIGKIDPWFDEHVQEWVFEHPMYPESCSGSTKKEVVTRYPLYLRQFIEQRLKHNLAPAVEKKTIGRGGRRAGAGRPLGTTKTLTRTVRLPLDIANWIKADPRHLEQVRRLSHK